MKRHPTRGGMGGFSLLEMMIAIVIGMFSVLVIMQVMSNTTTSRRIAVGGGDAQLNGVAALRALELDVEQSGLGLQSFNILGCSLSYTAADGGAVSLAALAPLNINPAVSIVPAGDANTDTVLVISGNSGSPSEGDTVTAATASTSYVVTTPDSFATGNQVIVAPSTRATGCALQAAQVTGVSGYTLTVSGGTSGLASGSIAYNLGSSPSVHAYAVRNGQLTMCDYVAYNCASTSYTSTLNSTVWVPLASNIVSLRVQYARDTSGISGSTSVMDGAVDTYDQVTPGAAGDSTTIATYCKWARLIGVRLVVVALSQQYDKTLSYTPGGPNLAAVTALTGNKTVLPVLTWDGSTAAPITLTATNWDHYRYSTLQTMIPLRNAIWQGSQPTYQGGSAGC